MCFNCGCNNPQDDMGHPDNITVNTLTHLSGHWGKSLEETKKIVLNLLESNDRKLDEGELKEMFLKAAKAWGQTIEEAQKNTLSLLKSQAARDMPV